MVTATKEITAILSIYCIIKLYIFATLALARCFCYASFRRGVKVVIRWNGVIPGTDTIKHSYR